MSSAKFPHAAECAGRMDHNDPVDQRMFFELSVTFHPSRCDCHVAEIKRLEAELDLSRQMLAAVKHSVVATVGGVDSEGYPTSEINYLQRLRILVEKERELEVMKSAGRQ